MGVEGRRAWAKLRRGRVGDASGTQNEGISSYIKLINQSSY